MEKLNYPRLKEKIKEAFEKEGMWPCSMSLTFDEFVDYSKQLETKFPLNDTLSIPYFDYMNTSFYPSKENEVTFLK